jgi:hypothetical protein
MKRKYKRTEIEVRWRGGVSPPVNHIDTRFEKFSAEGKSAFVKPVGAAYTIAVRVPT